MAAASARLTSVSTYITMLPPTGTGPRLAVKDLIDVRGTITTAGSLALAESAAPAQEDAPCMAGARAADAVIVGKANLYELAYGASGTNPWYGTPVNPLDPDLVPGGSSSGSAVAVADGDADVAYGSDTGGSIRIPAACCGITGLKTTHGRVSLAGVWPLAASLDTVGPMAIDVARVTLGMALLEPGFAVAASAAARLGRIRPAGITVDPRIDAAVDAALARSGIEIVPAEIPGWREARGANNDVIDAEAAVSNATLLADPHCRAKLSQPVLKALTEGEEQQPEVYQRALEFRRGWQAALNRLLAEVGVLVLPTMASFPPPLTDWSGFHFTALTGPVNLAGMPALALPVPSAHTLPASLQLIGPAGSEDLLLATGAVIEAAAGYRRAG
jgi:amidase